MIDEIRITSLSGRGSMVLKRGDHLGYWLGPVDWGEVEGDHQTYNYYNQVGESIVSTSIRSRPLSITGWVVDGTQGTLQTRCDVLNTFISPVEDYLLEYRGKKIRFRPDISVQYSPEYRRNNEKVRRFLIQATCPFPLFSDREDTEVLFDFKRKLFRFPTDFGRRKPLLFGITTKSYSVDVENIGGFSTGFVMLVTFSGEVKNLRVRNLTTDRFIGVNRTFARYERLEISTNPGSKSMKLYTPDGQTQNLMKYRDFQTTWFPLVPGTNRLSLDCDDLNQRANMNATVFFTPLYLEVE